MRTGGTVSESGPARISIRGRFARRLHLKRQRRGAGGRSPGTEHPSISAQTADTLRPGSVHRGSAG